MGAVISEAIELRRVERDAVARCVVTAVSGDGTYSAAVTGDNVFQFSRVYRPKWATVSGWVFTIGLLGAGFWLFLIKRTETCTVVVSEERALVRVTLTGTLTPEVRERLRRALDEAESAGAIFVDPVIAAPTRSLPTTVIRPEERRSSVIDLTVDEVPRAPIVAAYPAVRFGTGERIEIDRVTFVGRDPVRCDESGHAVRTLTINHPTVSKTHFAMGTGSGGLWIEDLHSTNGTAVGTEAVARRLTPGDRVAVSAGQTIFFGDLTALVLASDDDRVVGSVPPSGPSSLG